MYTKDLKKTKGIALIYLIMIILSILIISAVAIVGVTRKVKKGGTNQEISQETSEAEENKNTENSSNTSKGTKVTAEQIAKKPEKYYGQEVKNYTEGNRVYRIFYVDTEGYFGDKNTIYLKADWTANDINLKEKGIDTYTPKTKEILKKMNQEWAKERLNATWNGNEHCAAWLCDPTTKDSSSNQEWANYFDESKANYVIGSQSVEMFVKSYNQVSHEIGNYTLGASYRATAYPGYIYTLNGAKSKLRDGTDYSTGDDALDYKGYNSMYCGNNGTKAEHFMLLASPCALDQNYVCLVSENVARLGGGNWRSTYDISPLVSLKSDFTPEI